MSFEKPNVEGGESIERKERRIRNSIQYDLMSRMCNPGDEQAGIDRWLDSYADSFNVIFNEILFRDPEYLNKWDNNIDDEQSKSIDFFKDELERLDGPIEQAA